MLYLWLLKSFKLQLARQLAARPNRAQRRRSLSGFDLLEAREVPAFLAPASFTSGTNPAGIAVGDYNGDGKQDMAVVNLAAAGTIGVFLSNGDGTFQTQVDYPAGSYPADATAADFNGDGKTDIAVGGTDMMVLISNGDGTFAPATTVSGAIQSHSVRNGDFNNDGFADIATMNSGNASVLLGNGDGTFQARKNTPLIGNSINAVVGDFNRDGSLDLATSSTTSIGTVDVLRGHGDGSFDAAVSYYAYTAPVYLASGDLNHDGYDDFVVANSYAATSMSVIINNVDGSYAPPVTYSIAQTGYEIEMADFDNDGNQDYAVRGGSSYMVGHGKGDGTFYPAETFATPSGRFEAGTHGDFNGDGAIDLAYPSTAGVTVVMNANDNVANLAGAVGFAISAPATTTSGSSVPLTVTAVDASGNPATGYVGTVYVTSNDPLSKSSLIYKFTTADNGTHTFASGVKLVTLGDQTVSFAAPFMQSTTKTVNVTPSVSKFSVSAPVSAVAGESFEVTVTALDSVGQTASGYTSSVRFTSGDSLAGLPNDYMFTVADAGSHTFTVTLKTAGSKYVGVTEPGGPANGGSNVNVTPAAVSGLTLSGAGGAIGVSRPVTVFANDAFGNLVPTCGDTVRITSSDALATLPGDVSLRNGIATFNITLLTVGTQTITATGIADASITGTVASDATPPIPASFDVSGFPATMAGVARNFTVTVRDTIGQIASGYLGTVYFSSSDVRAGLPAIYTFTAADAGSHTFAATLKTAGVQQIKVTDNTGALTGTEVGIPVTAATFAGYRLNVPNGADSKGHVLVTAGESILLTVRASDSYGNTVAGYRGKVKFTSTDSKATLPTTYSFTPEDAGSHTFSVTLRTTTPNNVVWSYTVVDSSNAAMTATITNFEVMNAEAAKFILSVPSKITAGTSFTLKIDVLDAFGNRVKNYFGTIHFGNTAGSIGLPGDYTFTTNDSGSASVLVTLSVTGAQTLSVTDLTTSTLTANVTVSVQAAAKTGGGGTGGGGKTPKIAVTKAPAPKPAPVKAAAKPPVRPV